MKKITINIAIMIFAAVSALAAEQTIEINTSAECDMCKEAIEEAVNDLSGVESCDLDIASKVLTVTYEDEDLEKETIKKAINMAGYDADDTKATKRGLRNLPDCCKPGGMGK
jgi:copper chaperone CopZ